MTFIWTADNCYKRYIGRLTERVKHQAREGETRSQFIVSWFRGGIGIHSEGTITGNKQPQFRFLE
jgi:hypothetical protein